MNLIGNALNIDVELTPLYHRTRATGIEEDGIRTYIYTVIPLDPTCFPPSVRNFYLNSSAFLEFRSKFSKNSLKLKNTVNDVPGKDPLERPQKGLQGPYFAWKDPLDPC